MPNTPNGYISVDPVGAQEKILEEFQIFKAPLEH